MLFAFIAVEISSPHFVCAYSIRCLRHHPYTFCHGFRCVAFLPPPPPYLERLFLGRVVLFAKFIPLTVRLLAK